MKDREELIAFEMNYCQHYQPRGGMTNPCVQGLDVNAIRLPRNGDVFGQPCLAGHLLPDATAICPNWIRRTREMGEARADAYEAFRRNMTLVGPVVAAWRTWSKKNRVSKSEVIECPACKGRLHLSQSSYNGHVHGRCETADCVSWME